MTYGFSFVPPDLSRLLTHNCACSPPPSSPEVSRKMACRLRRVQASEDDEAFRWSSCRCRILGSANGDIPDCGRPFVDAWPPLACHGNSNMVRGKCPIRCQTCESGELLALLLRDAP